MVVPLNAVAYYRHLLARVLYRLQNGWFAKSGPAEKGNCSDRVARKEGTTHWLGSSPCRKANLGGERDDAEI